jgi:chemotaxis protein methyltransferase CheR
MSPGRPEMSAAEFVLLRDLIHEHAGLYFDDGKKYLLARRLAPRLEVTGTRNFAEYARMLRFGRRASEELAEVLDRVTTNETYFFREEYQLDAFRDEILPELRQQAPRGRRLCVWSAGCSTGEEPYTISMLIQEAGGFSDWDVRIVGSDISRRALDSARKARYRRRAMRQTSDTRLRRFFREAEGEHQPIDRVRAPVSFARINLLDEDAQDLVGPVDVLFCRNVLIYFDAPVRERVITSFYNRLVPGGYLLLGHSETLLNLSTAFELVQLRNDTVYRKPAR